MSMKMHLALKKGRKDFHETVKIDIKVMVGDSVTLSFYEEPKNPDLLMVVWYKDNKDPDYM